MAENMKRDAGLSEGIVSVDRSMNGPGVLIHRATRDEFVHLKFVAGEQLSDGIVMPEAPNLEQRIRLVVGHATHAITLEPPFAIDNLYVYEGDEIWAAATVPNALVATGFATTRSR